MTFLKVFTVLWFNTVILMDWIEITAQAIGIVGSVLIIGSFQMKSNKWLFVCQMLGSLMFTVNFFMLGSYAGSLMNFVSCIRGVLLLAGGKWSKPWICAVLCAIYIVSGVFTYDGICSVLITISSVVVTVAMWTRNGKNIRLANFFTNSPAWLVNNIYYFSLGGIITEVVSLVSVLVSFIRFGFNGFEDGSKKLNEVN